MQTTYSDDIIFDAFTILKGQYGPSLSVDIILYLTGHPCISDVRTQSINNGRTDLVKRMLTTDWMDVTSSSHRSLKIKELVRLYLLGVQSEEMFTGLYVEFQNLLMSPDDILYYLNPLKFKGYEVCALNLMKIDKSLDYTGFISACLREKINQEAVNAFSDRVSR